MRIRRRTGCAAFLVAFLQAGGTAAQSPTGTVSGAVSLPSPDGQPVIVPGVMLTLTCTGLEPRIDVSSEMGQFRFADVSVGACSIIAELQGFKSAVQAFTVRPGETADVSLRLDVEALHVDVSVIGSPDTVESGSITARVERITASEMQTAPIASERFQDALPLIPGVVRGPDGLLNINGTRSNQSALMFNNADGTDPVTGEDAIELPIDAVSAVQVQAPRSRLSLVCRRER
jgi:carboxypeptidase family protein